MKELTRYNPTRLGAMVRHMRTEAGLTQEVLGEGVGLDRTSIARIEAGKHTLSLEHLMLVAKVCEFEISVSINRKVK